MHGPIGLSTGCFHDRGILDCLEPIRNAGFMTLEICSSAPHLDYNDRSMVARAAERIAELRLEPYSFHAPFSERIDITHPDSASRQRALDEIRRAADAAATLGARHFVIHPGPERGDLPGNERLQRMTNAAGVLDAVARHCHDRGVMLVLENMLPHLFSGHVQDLLWLLGALHETDVGVCLDTGHAFLSGDLHTVVHKLSGHLWMIHANDNGGERDDHLPPGDGKIPWEALLRQVAASGFHGGIILEISGARGEEALFEGARRARNLLIELGRRADVGVPKEAVP
jgi:sugar phosphate isomerase/epimerase